jgi:hypothetical protein
LGKTCIKINPLTVIKSMLQLVDDCITWHLSKIENLLMLFWLWYFIKLLQMPVQNLP